MKFKPDPWQTEFLETESDKILCCGRQIGKSEIAAIDACNYISKHPEQTILMIAPTERQAFSLFDKTLDAILTTNPKLVARGKHRPTQTKITTTKGGQIWCLPVGKAGIGVRFLTIHRLYGEEASRIPDSVWTAVMPMLLTTGGKVILLSTPAGCQGFFYDCFINKDNAFISFKRFSKESEVVVREREICATWTQQQQDDALNHIAQAKARMSNFEFEQEYLGRFSDRLHRFFTTELIEKCTVIERSCMSSCQTAPLASLNDNSYLGVDIASMGEDETAMVVLKKSGDRLIQIDQEVTTKTFISETVQRILILDSKYKFRRIYVDDGGLGVAVFQALLKSDQTKRRVEAINNSRRSLDRDETRQKRLDKEALYFNLLKLMESGQIQLFNDDDLILSLKSVQYEVEDGKTLIFGNYTHLTESLVRAAWGINDKTLKLWVR